jgi:DNA-binding transcriptional LysR family regulator
LVVGDERSFTNAAAKLGVSQSALSHTICGLQERLGVGELIRTTRKVAPTETGKRLPRTIGPRFQEIEAGLDAAPGTKMVVPKGGLDSTRNSQSRCLTEVLSCTKRELAMSTFISHQEMLKDLNH